MDSENSSDHKGGLPRGGGTPTASIDSRGRVVGWSSGARDLLGYEADEVVGRGASELLAAKLPLSTLARLPKGTEWGDTLVLRHRDGYAVDAAVWAVRQRGPGGRDVWTLYAVNSLSSPEAEDHVSAHVALREAALSQLPVAVAVHDSGGSMVGANHAFLRLMVEQRPGHDPPDAEPRLDSPHDHVTRFVLRVLETGKPVQQELSVASPEGRRPRTWSVLVSPVQDTSGRTRGATTTLSDITDAARARWRLAVVNEASVRIGTSLEVVRTAEELAELAVNRFADYVAVDLLDTVYSGGESKPGSPADTTAMRRAANRSVIQGCPEAVFAPGDLSLFQATSPLSHALVSGRPARFDVDDPEIAAWLSTRPLQSWNARAFGMHSALFIPIRARETPLGFALFVRHRTPEPFDDDDLLLADEITARAAVCIDNARRYTRERLTSLTLQRSLLPRRAPSEAALDVASRYLPAGAQAGVGGDWFDVIPLSGARVALVVGDVVGHGVHASATMGRLRTAVRTLADVDLSPEELLTRLDDLVLRMDREEGWDRDDGDAPASAGEVGATCLYAVYDPVSRRCTVARAGHPPPALVRPDGVVQFPDLPAGPPLGLGGLPFESRVLDLPEDSLIALYTDGLVESADHDMDAGIGRLREALSDAHGPLEQICDKVVADLLPDAPTDDVALLIARTYALDSSHVATWDLPADPTVVAHARKQTAERLEAWGLEEVSFVAELVVSELVTNAIRYGGAPIQLRLIRGHALILEVTDANSTAPHLRRARTFDEGGRGLLLVAQLTDRWGTRHSMSGGKTIWAELRLADGS